MALQPRIFSEKRLCLVIDSIYSQVSLLKQYFNNCSLRQLMINSHFERTFLIIVIILFTQQIYTKCLCSSNMARKLKTNIAIFMRFLDVHFHLRVLDKFTQNG